MGAVAFLALVVCVGAHGVLAASVFRARWGERKRVSALVRGALALAVPPLAPYWAWAHGMRVRVWVWVGTIAAYAIAVAIASR